ncbi:MAG: hypothetical protein IT373_10070 [Polyangiaceae bacterium]|nr:hypothetical protein [Polyangiaceae bacterium]
MVAHNALASLDRPEPLFPAGHPLGRLVRPTFDTLRRSLRDMYVATIWVDAVEDPSRAGFRPSYDSLRGPGSALMMPFVGAWLSTGPGSERGGNTVFFMEGMDLTLVDYAKRVGLLGAYELVPSVRAMKERVRQRGGRLYDIDDLGVDFDDCSVVRTDVSRWLNSKEGLDTITSYGPREVVKDMYEVALADFEHARGAGGRVFLKTCNTENAGSGVFIAATAAEFEAELAKIRDKQARFGLSRRLVVQPEIRGTNKSFQVFLDPKAPGEIQVVALSDQLVEADGKTYRSSVNHAITRATVEPVGAAILDMVDHIWARHPEAFGFLMSDYFQTAAGPVIYDPGLRPTGNTATAMAAHLARKLTDRDFATCLLPLPTERPGLTFEAFARRAGVLVDPENLKVDGRALLPWGWNPVQGFGLVIAVAPEQAALDGLCAEALRFDYGAP